MRSLSLVNQKGGCGKTTVAINLGAALTALGERVLVVDLDPQAHATLGLGCSAERGATVLDVLADGVPVHDGLLDVPGGMRLLPANARLAEFEETSARMIRPESALRRALEGVADDFDWALLDCPARADGVLTSTALCASTAAVLVVETGVFSLQGALRAMQLLREVAGNQGSSFDMRVLCTLFERRTRLAREILVAMQARFASMLFDTAIRTSVRLREAALRGVPVQVLAPRSRAALEFASLALEVQRMPFSIGRPIERAVEPPLEPRNTAAARAAPGWGMEARSGGAEEDDPGF